MADATADSTIFENEGSWVFFDEQLFTKALKPHVRQAIAVANEGSVLFPTDNELDVRLTDAELTEELVFTETISVPINLDGVLSEGEVFKSLDVSINFDSEDTEVNEGGSLIGDDSVDFFLDNVITEGPWEAPWMPQDRSLSSLDGAFDVYPADPYFYLNFDEPHGIPKRIKDGWQRGTEATYWDGSQLRTAAPNEPRVQVDPETGERYLLAEPQRGNTVNRSENYAAQYDPIDWIERDAGIAPDGTMTADKVTGYFYADGSNARWFSTGDICLSFFVKPITDFSELYLKSNNGNRDVFYLDTLNAVGDSLTHDIGVIAYPNEWYRCWAIVENSRRFVPSFNIYQDEVPGREAYFWGMQAEPGLVYPSSYIPSPGSGTSTRAPDDLSDLPFSMESGAKSVYVRISQEANGYAPNEGGNITNAEVNLTDTPGDAGGGLLRPSTGILGISADGWIDAVVNSTDEDLQGNSTSDVVDGLTVQPDKSASTDGAIYRIHELVAWEEERSYSERRSLTSQRPQPWQELDAPNINTLDNLNGDIDWSNLGISEPPHLNIDIPRFGIPAKMKSAWQRDTEATYWDSNGVLQTADPRVPRKARSYDGSSWNVQGVLAEPQRQNRKEFARPTNGRSDGATTPWGGKWATGKTGIDGKNLAGELYPDPNASTPEAQDRLAENIPTHAWGWTASFFVKKDTHTFGWQMRLKQGDGSHIPTITAGIDLSTGEVTRLNANPKEGAVEVEDVGDWWYVKSTQNNKGANSKAEYRFRTGGDGSTGEGHGIIVDGLQLEAHHQVATDGNGYADATHATMPILQGGATRSEDRLVMPVWWSTGHISGGYYEAYWQSGGIYGGGNGANWREAFLNITSQSFGYDEGLNGYSGLGGGTDKTDFLSQNRKDGWVDHAVNSDDPKKSRQEMERLYILPDRKPSNVDGATFILRRLYLWPQELTEGSGGQLESLFNHDFSV